MYTYARCMSQECEMMPVAGIRCNVLCSKAEFPDLSQAISTAQMSPVLVVEHLQLISWCIWEPSTASVPALGHSAGLQLNLWPRGPQAERLALRQSERSLTGERSRLGRGWARRVPAESQWISVCQSECAFLFVFSFISCPLKMRNITLFNYVSHVQARCLKHGKHSINVYCVNEDMYV